MMQIILYKNYLKQINSDTFPEMHGLNIPQKYSFQFWKTSYN